MITAVTLFAALGILFGIAALTCGMTRSFVSRTGGAGTASVDPKASGAWRAGARLCLVLSCLCVLAAFGNAWVESQVPESVSSPPMPASWGALWVYVLALLVEWNRSGLEVANRRTLAGALLAGVGVLLVGMCLAAWTTMSPPPVPECVGGSLSIDARASAAGSVAALGLALVPLGGIALRLAKPTVPPLSAAAACVVMAMWFQPTLPSLGWLPVSPGAGAPLAAVLVVALMLLGLMAAQGPRATVAGVGLYFGLSVGGSHLLGTLQT